MKRSATRRTSSPRESRSVAGSGIIGAALEAVRDRAGAQASELVQQVKEGSQEFLSDRKSLVAGQLTNVSGAIRRAADKLHDTESEFLATYVDSAAERVDEIGRYLEQHDLRDVIEDVGDLARRQPALFLGGMFVAGLVASRFVKAASAPPTRRARR